MRFVILVIESEIERKVKPLVHVDIGFLASDVGKTTADTFNRGQRKHDLLFPIDVGVLHTKNVLELFVRYQRLQRSNNREIHQLETHKEIHEDSFLEKFQWLTIASVSDRVDAEAALVLVNAAKTEEAPKP